MEAEPTLDIDVNRAITVSDLSINDLTAEIGIELPKKWTERFQAKAEFKRINKATAEAANGEQNSSDNTGGETTGGGTTGGGDDTPAVNEP